MNSFGNLGGFVGPYTVGALYDATGSFAAGLLACAGAMALALGLMAFAAPDPRRPGTEPRSEELNARPTAPQHEAVPEERA